MMEFIANADEMLQAMCKHKTGIAIDDFDNGYSVPDILIMLTIH
jgi:EAL domain-containing protein (putative c-di-GMP-specific phosphodiesterase class I)